MLGFWGVAYDDGVLGGFGGLGFLGCEVVP